MLERCQRRTVCLAVQAEAVVRGVGGPGRCPLPWELVSRHTALRSLLRIPLPTVATPRVLGEEPAVSVLQLLREIRERGYTGSQNLLSHYITQGRVEDDRPALHPADWPGVADGAEGDRACSIRHREFSRRKICRCRLP
ncbi:Uncharacterised protein [Mycobacterium tuberculosis]|nr:Uncharacterised protein [Mycobacterium tuberculosis]